MVLMQLAVGKETEIRKEFLLALETVVQYDYYMHVKSASWMWKALFHLPPTPPPPNLSQRLQCYTAISCCCGKCGWGPTPSLSTTSLPHIPTHRFLYCSDFQSPAIARLLSLSDFTKLDFYPVFYCIVHAMCYALARIYLHLSIIYI